jgi:tetratricopeptide (TPR) repeat protein
VHHQQGQFEEAIEAGERALAIVEETAHYREIAQAHNELGNAFEGFSQPEKAIANYQRGQFILERIGDEHGAATIYNNLAFIYYQTEPTRSLSYVTRYLETMQRLGDIWSEATAYQNLGVIHYSRGDLDQAIEFYQRSLQTKKHLGDSLGIADCQINLGEAYRTRGDLAEAIDHLKQGLMLAQQIGASQAETECHRQMAECYLEMHQPHLALEVCLEAGRHADSIGDLKEQGMIEQVMGNAYRQLQDYTAAINHFQRGITLLKESNRESDLGSTIYDYALTLVEAGKVAQAREQLQEALTLYERLQLSQEITRIQSTLSTLD